MLTVVLTKETRTGNPTQKGLLCIEMPVIFMIFLHITLIASAKSHNHISGQLRVVSCMSYGWTEKSCTNKKMDLVYVQVFIVQLFKAYRIMLKLGQLV